MEENSKKKKDNKKNISGIIFFLIAFLLVGGMILLNDSDDKVGTEISFLELEKLISEGKVIQESSQPLEMVVKSGSPTQTLRGFYKKTTDTYDGGTIDVPTPFRSTIFVDYNAEDLRKLLQEAKLTPTVKLDSNTFGTFLFHLLPMILFLIVLYLIFSSQIRAQGRGAFGFGKSKAKMMEKSDLKVTFKDVAGVEEAKEEVAELVDFLKDPKKFQKLGGRMPKGVLMAGSPGTGKTLLARAIAGEADVPFFSISGSDFVEMFVGVGASRVRNMFEQGKKNAPCLIFIDEIDAVGRHRGGGMGGGHDEREQTLNALLVEMDGFDTQSGIIIIAATNRPDVLDPALLRPGRFDRQVNVDLPDVKGREEILRVHCKKTKLSESVDLEKIARGTPGYSGAELANVVNEAALLAARRGLNAIGMKELEEARDKVRWGKERRSLSISLAEKKVTAYHEAGHALLLMGLDHTEPLHKVTIIPRGPSLGSTMWLPKADKYNTNKKELLDQIAVIMGGRVAEEIQFGDITSGASGDIQQATTIAKNMVCKWGMSEKIGMINYAPAEDSMFLARDISKMKTFSEKTAETIDQEIKLIIDEAYLRAKSYLQDRREDLNTLAQALLEFETLEEKEISLILNSNEADKLEVLREKRRKEEK